MSAWKIALFLVLSTGLGFAKVPPKSFEYYQHVSENDVRFKFEEGPDPDVYRNVSQLISSKGYPVEEHDVVTKDGYILGIQRIPRGKTRSHQDVIVSLDGILDTGTREERLGVALPDSTTTELPTTTSAPTGNKVILLHHGLLNSAADWVINEVNQSLGYILADNGYDVWFANARGNTYSRRHATLKPSDKAFWKFSWDEMAAYDLPATIDYILRVTGEEQIHYVGHSMGTTIAFALLSEKPEYNDKLKSVMALAPVTTVTYMTSPIRFITPFYYDLEILLDLLGDYDFLPNNEVMRFLSTLFCRPTQLRSICENIVFLITGTESKQVNESRLEVITHHAPAGTSTMTVVHYGQLVKANKFQKFDYGEKENQKKYGQPTPPEYPIERITTPIALFWSDNDLLADPTDVALLKPKIQKLIDFYQVPFPPWTHLDYVYGIDTKKYVFDHLLELLSRQ